MISKYFLYIFIISLSFTLNVSYAEDLHKTTVKGCFDHGGTDGTRYFWLKPNDSEYFEVAWEELTQEQWDMFNDCLCNGDKSCTATISYTTDSEDYDTNSDSTKGLIRKINSIKK